MRHLSTPQTIVFKGELTLSRRRVSGHWQFRDGVSLKDSLDVIDVERIRAVCGEQSRSQWTKIASRERLYQFIAMSEERTQSEIRKKLQTSSWVEEAGQPSRAGTVLSSTPLNSRGTKRYAMYDMTVNERRFDPQVCIPQKKKHGQLPKPSFLRWRKH